MGAAIPVVLRSNGLRISVRGPNPFVLEGL